MSWAGLRPRILLARSVGTVVLALRRAGPAADRSHGNVVPVVRHHHGLPAATVHHHPVLPVPLLLGPPVETVVATTAALAAVVATIKVLRVARHGLSKAVVVFRLGRLRRLQEVHHRGKLVVRPGTVVERPVLLNGSKLRRPRLLTMSLHLLHHRPELIAVYREVIEQQWRIQQANPTIERRGDRSKDAQGICQVLLPVMTRVTNLGSFSRH
ncbi:hypothetical protein EJ03DRAFT_151629 [Teratosphaeria nubilosa]|uniref:Secreted protein n=1 Tax=Teratosphaeria nubilosa TaxID=161662 RepID=A0A6G1LKC3_9PEZI|nr:hypothetical protein EJ03DRAFT_151629 [Teratosphaeria nubilosa]